MQKWEYKTCKMSRIPIDPVFSFGKTVTAHWQGYLDINQLGKEGWELISVIGLPEFEKEPGTKTSTSLYFYFKRQIKEKSNLFAPFPSPIEKFAKTSIGDFRHALELILSDMDIQCSFPGVYDLTSAFMIMINTEREKAQEYLKKNPKETI